MKLALIHHGWTQIAQDDSVKWVRIFEVDPGETVESLAERVFQSEHSSKWHGDVGLLCVVEEAQE